MAFLSILLLFAVPSVLGAVSLTALKIFREKVVLLLAGSAAGLAVITFLTYLTTSFNPLSKSTLTAAVLAAAVGTVIILFKTPAVSHWRACYTDRAAVVILILLTALCVLVAPKLLLPRPDGSLYNGIINAYGDIGWHAASVANLAESNTVPPQDPIVAGRRLTYPFMVNFFSAMLLKSGASLSQSVVWPALLLMPLALTLLYCFVRQLTGKKSAAIVALLLFVFGGAVMGWPRIFHDWQLQNDTWWYFLTHLPNRDYSGVGVDRQGFHFINPVFTLLPVQQAFLFGLPLALIITTLLFSGRDNVRRLAAAGVLAGILPLFHAHTALALAPVVAGALLLYPRGRWHFFLLPAILAGIPALLYYGTGSLESGSFFRLEPGWLAGQENIFWYWLKNTGLLLPVILLGFFLPAPRQAKILAAAGLTIFAAANILLFAPWAWDNYKLLLYWLVFSLPLIGWTAAQAFAPRYSVLVSFGAAVLIALHLISGALDVWKLSLPTAQAYLEWPAQRVRAASAIRSATAPGQAILTAPIHNSAAALAGRPVYLGFFHHVWSHGRDPRPRLDAAKKFYEGRSDQLPGADIKYVLVGPAERSLYPGLKIRPGWQLVFQQDSHTLYRLPNY